MRTLAYTVTLVLAIAPHARTQIVSSARLALADSVLVAMNLERSMPAAMASVLATTQAGDTATTGFPAFARKYLTPDVIRPRIARVYAQTFDDSELRDLIRFYSSSTGRKLVSVQPDLAAQNQKLIADIIHEHLAEYRQMTAPPR